jgi:hypothetical protein
MSGIKDQEHIDELRRRLYERGPETPSIERHTLAPQVVDVSRGWESVTVPLSPEIQLAENPDTHIVPGPVLEGDDSITAYMSHKPKRRYRLIVLAASLAIFALMTAVASMFLFFGTNQISAKNIDLQIQAPFAMAGGETANLQATISNQNSVPIQSAVLIVNYPAGTRSTEEGGRELYEERITINDVSPGQVINVPFKAIIFGEENEDKTIKVAVEYRVDGSNGTFFKEAEPQVIKITSSPIIVRVSGVDKISSGQEIELTLLIQSNTATVQNNILVSAAYPNSFTFSEASPEAVYGENSWLIKELPANGTAEIIIKGSVAGQSGEQGEVQVRVGNPQLNNQFIMDSVLSQARFGYVIEQPFTGVTMAVNGDTDGVVVVEPGKPAAVSVTVQNTLADPVYDMRVVLKPTGNLIRDDHVSPSGGYYDASAQTITYEVSGQGDLAEVGPGETRTFSFTVTPDTKQTTASFSVSVGVYARRVNERNAAETLIGTSGTEVKYSSTATIGSELGYGNGPYEDAGPVPPVAGQPTTYTITLVAGAGVNDMTGAVVTTNLPQYVSWLDETDGAGTIEFNPVSKQLKWNVGDVSAGQRLSRTFQVSLLPSVTQVGRTVTVMGPQELRATDRFTGVTLRAEQKELINELSTELGFIRNNGEVRASETDN